MDFVTIAFSTFFSAAVALLADRWTRRYDVRFREETTINSLILDLAAKRAFLLADDWDWVDGDLERVVGSIDHARRLIIDARVALRPSSMALPQLRQTSRACSMFLEMTEHVDSQSPKGRLDARLTDDISKEVETLRAAAPKRIFADLPGGFALDSTV